MAILQALIAAILRSAGRLFNTAFSWATVMLFGQVPQDRQIYLSALAFGAVIWIIALAGVIVPSFAAFMMTFVTVPSWIDKNWIRLGLVVAVIVIPAIVGWLSTRTVTSEHRPRGGRAMTIAVLKGYPYTVGLALTLIMMTILAPVKKVRNLARRWTEHHVPVIVKADDYLTVVDDIQRALTAGGFPTERKRASWMLRMPTRFLGLFARTSIATLVADQLTRLTSDRAEVLVHPSDLVISGRDLDASHARAILTEHLTYTRAYLTWDKEANDVEDRLRQAWDDVAAHRAERARQTLRQIRRELATLELPYEEWEVLFRQTLLVELRAAMADARAEVIGPRSARIITALIAASPLIEEATGAVRDTVRAVTRGRADSPPG